METSNYIGYIYEIYNIENGMKYIGQTRQSVELRFKQHFFKSSTNSYFHKELRKRPDNFSYRIIDTITSKHSKDLQRKLDKTERKYIKEYNTLQPYGYNILPGGRSAIPGKAVDQYTIDGIYVATYDSETEAGEANNIHHQSVMDVCKGKRPHTRRMVFRYHGDPFDKYDVLNKNNNLGVQIIKYDLFGSVMRVYSSISECAKAEFNGDASYASSLVKDHKTVKYQFVLFREDEQFDKSVIKYRNVGRPVEKYSKDGEYLETYPSLKDAAKANNCSSTAILDVIRGRVRTCFGFVYKYYEPTINVT